VFYYAKVQYTSRFCPYCGFTWTRELGHGHIHLGPEFITCTQCRGTFRSGLREWPTLNPFEQRKYRTKWMPSIAIFWAFFGCLMVYSCGSNNVPDQDFNIQFFLILWMVITGLCGIVVAILSAKRSTQIQLSCLRYFTIVANHQAAQQRANLAVKR